MSSSLPAFTMARVTASTLWARARVTGRMVMTDDDRGGVARMAGRKTSPTRMSDVFKEPWYISTGSPSTRLRVSSSSTYRYSWSRCIIIGWKIAAASAGERICRRSSSGASNLRLTSRAAFRRAAALVPMLVI